MNERIEELAKQCVSMSFYVDTASENFDYQKFAKLIAQECADLCVSNLVDEICGGKDLSEKIKKHFGVEE